MSKQSDGPRGQVLDVRPHLRDRAEQQTIGDEMHLGMTLQALYGPEEANRMIAERREREAARLKALESDHDPWAPRQPREDLEEAWERFFRSPGDD